MGMKTECYILFGPAMEEIYTTLLNQKPDTYADKYKSFESPVKNYKYTVIACHVFYGDKNINVIINFVNGYMFTPFGQAEISII